jgi:hypothetical protein
LSASCISGEASIGSCWSRLLRPAMPVAVPPGATPLTLTLGASS